MVMLMFFFSFRGFCYFNSVAIAARLLRLRMSVEKVLVIDWVCLKCLLNVTYTKMRLYSQSDVLSARVYYLD
jgi:hypothetical protein